MACLWLIHRRALTQIGSKSVLASHGCFGNRVSKCDVVRSREYIYIYDIYIQYIIYRYHSEILILGNTSMFSPIHFQFRYLDRIWLKNDSVSCWIPDTTNVAGNNFDVISKACLASGFGHCGSWTRDRLGLMQESRSWRGFPHIQDDSWWCNSLSLGSHEFRSASQWRSRMLEVLRRFGEMDEQGNLRRFKSSDCCLNCWTEMRDPKAVVDLYWN